MARCRAQSTPQMWTWTLCRCIPRQWFSRTATLGYGVTVSVTDYEVYRSSTQQEVWYYVTAGSVQGWISAGYVKLSGSRQCDLTYVDSTVLAINFLQWNTGGIEGLVNRRIAECNIFFFGDYEKAMKAKPIGA